MGFFLVGRNRDDGGLRLLADTEFATRQDAIDALTAVSIDPALESEVFVVNLDSATPVLLVERGVPEEQAQQPEPYVEEPYIEPAPEPEEEPEAEPPAPPAAEETVEAAAESAALEPALAEEAPGGLIPEPIAEAMSAESERESRVEAQAAEVVTPEPEGAASLTDALRRATGALEAEGIVAPESVGPEPSELIAETAADPELESEASAMPVSPGEDAEAGWPWSESDAEAPGESAAEPEPAAEEMPAEAAYVPDPLEEPAISDEPIMSASTGEEAFDMSRPVVMGAYMSDEPAEPAGEVEPVAESAQILEPEPVSEGILADLQFDAAAESPGAPMPTEPVSAPPVAPAGFEPPAPPTAEATQATSHDADTPGLGETDLSAMSCDDCVYVNTCPNKDDRDPSSCGSFQWKPA